MNLRTVRAAEGLALRRLRADSPRPTALCRAVQQLEFARYNSGRRGRVVQHAWGNSKCRVVCKLEGKRTAGTPMSDPAARNISRRTVAVILFSAFLEVNLNVAYFT
jgi:hypothetical protein